MAAGIDRFSKLQFEEAIASITWIKSSKCELKDGQYVYSLNFGSPFVEIALFSSVDASGFARDNAEDSIRACLSSEGKLLPGKVQTYVTRRANWRINLSNMLKQLGKLAAWIQPCPKCGKLLQLKIRRQDKEVFLFCRSDAENKNTVGYERHVPLTVIDFNDATELRSITPETLTEETPKCPKCSIPLRKVLIQRGPNSGRHAWSCPAKQGGKFLNHIFTVIEDEQTEE